MEKIILPGFDAEEAAKFQAAAARLDLFKARKAAAESAALLLRARIAARFVAVCAEVGAPLGKGRDSLPVKSAEDAYREPEVPKITEAEAAAIAADVAAAAAAAAAAA